jgi:hypothetical protein
MVGTGPVYFDPETVTVLREILDEAWSRLPPERQATMQKTALAERRRCTAASCSICPACYRCSRASPSSICTIRGARTGASSSRFLAG